MKYFAFLFFLSFIYTGCTDCDCPTTPSTQTTLEQTVFNDIAGVITTSYDELYNSSIELQAALSHFRDEKTQVTLDAAREAYRVCRAKWMMSQAFLFGPIKTANLISTLNTWPISPTNLGGTILTPDDIHFRDGSVKGFHTIEYLIFGDSVNKQISDFKEREFDYLSALLMEFTRQIEYLTAIWANYAVNVEKAGTTESEFATIKDAFKTICVNQSFFLDAPENTTIFKEFYDPNPKSIESQYSRNTNQDFANLIHGVKNVYLGGYGIEGKGLSALVAPSDKALDTKIREELDALVVAINDMTPWYGEAIITNTAKVMIVKTMLQTLQIDLNAATTILTK